MSADFYTVFVYVTIKLVVHTEDWHCNLAVSTRQLNLTNLYVFYHYQHSVCRPGRCPEILKIVLKFNLCPAFLTHVLKSVKSKTAVSYAAVHL